MEQPEQPVPTDCKLDAAFEAIGREQVARHNETPREPQRGATFTMFNSFFNRMRLVMSLPQNLVDDLSVLDADSATSVAATATRVQAEATQAAAIAATQAASSDENKALTAQNTQLAKVKADLDAIYGPPVVTPPATA